MALLILPDSLESEVFEDDAKAGIQGELYDQRRKNVDWAERLYTDQQHMALGVEPADAILPGCLMKVHVAPGNRRALAGDRVERQSY